MNTYIITKSARANSIKEAIKKEESAELISVQLQEEQPETQKMGFKS